jgi:CheY-like chemotaxis protein
MEKTPANSSDGAQKRLLIVDDDPGVRTMLGRVLTGEGYLVQAAGDGEEALVVAGAQPFDLVILDLTLPPTDGWDVFLRLRTAHPLLPVVVITARFGQAGAATLAGVDALLEKPLDYPTLLQTLAQVLAAPATAKLARGVPRPLPFHAQRD